MASTWARRSAAASTKSGSCRRRCTAAWSTWNRVCRTARRMVNLLEGMQYRQVSRARPEQGFTRADQQHRSPAARSTSRMVKKSRSRARLISRTTVWRRSKTWTAAAASASSASIASYHHARSPNGEQPVRAAFRFPGSVGRHALDRHGRTISMSMTASARTPSAAVLANLTVFRSCDSQGSVP